MMLPESFSHFLVGFSLLVSAICWGADEPPKIIAHRGASANAPENTMAAFRLAWKEGADGIEADFFLSADGEVVCIHDSNTKKTGSGRLDVKKSTLAELRTLEYGSWKDPKFKGEQIPTLGQIIDELPEGKWFFLEIKDTPEIINPIAKILAEKRPNKDRLVLISFNTDVVRACRKAMPEYRACLISSLDKFQKKGNQKKYLEQIESSGSQGLAFKENSAATKEWLAEARGDDGILATWTVNNRDSAWRATERGSDFLITDRPAGLRAELDAVFQE